LIEVIDPRPDKTNEELANSVKYKRDEMGRVVRETREIDLVPGLHTIEYDYDYNGKLTRLTYPDAYHVDYEYYPGSGLLKSVTGSDNRKFAEYSNYQPSGKPGRVDYGSGSHTIYTYDPTTQRILTIYTEAPTIGALQNRQYSYYKTGDVEAISLDNLNAEFNFTYDSLNRLETVDGNGWGFINYEYDEIG
ncbi:MAG: hypothetical protein GY841_16460, partial [FCB group bacterium]|nr:hypothetical protein [FCB group bacterium]